MGSVEQKNSVNEEPLQNENDVGEVVDGDSEEQEDPDYMEDIDGIMGGNAIDLLRRTWS